jgi:hypothetical protein
MDQDLAALYESLSFPSALKFRRAAEVAGTPITLSAAKKYVATFSQRQVTAPANPHLGVITASQIDARWQADLASYVAQAAKVGKITYTHVLCVLDIFSRFLWTRKLRNAKTATVTKAFKSILEVSQRTPIEMNIDKGAEFNSAEFSKMLTDKGIDMVRVAEGRNDIATIDRAIATLKLLITKRTITTGAGNWAQELAKATSGYNKTGHTHLGLEAPGTVQNNESLQFEMQVQSGKDNDAQEKVSSKTNKNLEDAESYRIEEVSKLRGFAKGRSFKPKFQERIRQIDTAQSGGRYVVDTLGERTLRSRIKPVQTNSTSITIPETGGNTQRDPARIELTLGLAKTILGKIVGSTDIARITKELTAEQKKLMKENKLTQTRKFLELHSRLFKIVGRKVTKAPPTAEMLQEENAAKVKEIRKQSKFARKPAAQVRFNDDID